MKWLLAATMIFSGGCAPAAAPTTDERLPVRYVVCRVGSDACVTLARFHDLLACEHHREFSEWRCEHESMPGYAVCDKSRPFRDYSASCIQDGA